MKCVCFLLWHYWLRLTCLYMTSFAYWFIDWILFIHLFYFCLHIFFFAFMCFCFCVLRICIIFWFYDIWFWFWFYCVVIIVLIFSFYWHYLWLMIDHMMYYILWFVGFFLQRLISLCFFFTIFLFNPYFFLFKSFAVLHKYCNCTMFENISQFVLSGCAEFRDDGSRFYFLMTNLSMGIIT